MVSCKGKDKILGTSSNSILLPAEDVTVDYIGKNLDKYGTGKETPNKVFKILQLKYAKTIFGALNKESKKATIYFQVENQEEYRYSKVKKSDFDKNEENQIIENIKYVYMREYGRLKVRIGKIGEREVIQYIKFGGEN